MHSQLGVRKYLSSGLPLGLVQCVHVPCAYACQVQWLLGTYLQAVPACQH